MDKKTEIMFWQLGYEAGLRHAAELRQLENTERRAVIEASAEKLKPTMDKDDYRDLADTIGNRLSNSPSPKAKVLVIPIQLNLDEAKRQVREFADSMIHETDEKVQAIINARRTRET